MIMRLFLFLQEAVTSACSQITTLDVILQSHDPICQQKSMSPQGEITPSDTIL